MGVVLLLLKPKGIIEIFILFFSVFVCVNFIK